jgi:very-short-patch-repair endonuclease
MAAVLAGGPGAALSHWTAASNWGMVRSAASRVDVTVPNRREHRRGVRFHRSNLPRDEVTVHTGMPVTVPARTLFDIASGLPLPREATRPPRRFEAALNQAESLQLWDGPPLISLLERYPRRAGNRAVRLGLEWLAAGTTVTRSELEDKFVEFVDAYGFRRPEFNAWLVLDGRSMEVDALWRTERVAVELDSRQFHHTPEAFEADRCRDRKLIAAGWRPVRITWRQLTQEADAVAGDLREMLARAA